jgi:hypothetical protein
VTLSRGWRTLADVTVRQVHAGTPARRRVRWTLFWVVAALALGAGVVADLVYGGGDHLVAVIVSGLVVVGVAAAFMASPPSSKGRDHAPLGLKDGNNSGGWSAL